MAAASASASWFRGDNFRLNRIASIELSRDRLRSEELRQLEEADRQQALSDRWAVMEVPISDNRSGVDSSINRGAIGLEDLNASGTATALLATTFDWPQPGDVGWFKEKLHLSWDTEVTLCAHLWSHQHSAEERNALWQDLVNCFAAPVLHFTGTPEFSQPNAAVPSLEPEWVTSVHAKLMLLEFHDRLRVVITSANLAERFWESNNEVVWIKDFPKVTGGNPLQRVLASEFSTVFSHFLVQILHKAPLQRLEAWLFRTLSFDLTCGAGVRLVASLPGEHLPARALQANQVVLRLSLEEEREEWEDSGSLSGFVLKTSDTGTWCLSREQSDSDPVEMQLDEMSLTALTAAAHFNFNAYSGETEVSLSTGGPLSINVEATRFSSDLEGSRAPVTKLRVLLKATEATHLDAERSHESLLELANFLALLEVDYGLFALRRHLAHEIWPSEQHYVAVTSAMSVPGAWWLHDLDRCCGRQEAPDPGPQLVLPRSRPRVPSGYRWIHESLPGKVVEHRSPDHAPGRQKIPNHSKLLARSCSDRQDERCGWIYVGSHNLTSSAWGRIWRHETNEMDDGQEVLSVHNRELGVLLIQHPGSESELLSNAPWPFGFPLTPVHEEIDFESEEENQENEENEETNGISTAGEQWNWHQNWYQNWDSWNDEDTWDDWDWHESWQDWRLQRKNWWWWTTT